VKRGLYFEQNISREKKFERNKNKKKDPYFSRDLPVELQIKIVLPIISLLCGSPLE